MVNETDGKERYILIVNRQGKNDIYANKQRESL